MFVLLVFFQKKYIGPNYFLKVMSINDFNLDINLITLLEHMHYEVGNLNSIYTSSDLK